MVDQVTKNENKLIIKELKKSYFLVFYDKPIEE